MYQYLTQALHRAMQTRRNVVATVCGDRRRTYGEFGERVMRLAGALRALKLEPGERVGMLALNSDRYLEYYMAVWWAGGAVNPVNIRWSAAEIVYSLDDCETRILLVDDQFIGLIGGLREQSRCLETIIYAGDSLAPEGTLSYEDLIASHGPLTDAMRSDDDLCGVFYTGGTTGFPKGVMLSHTNLLSNAMSGVAEVPIPLDWRVLHVAPLFHLAAMTVVLRAFVRGITHVVLPAFEPVALMKAVQRDQISSLLMVPTMIQMVVDHPQMTSFDLSSLKQILYGASPISEALLDRAFAAFPNVEFAQGYGMTELSAGISFLHGQWHAPGGRVPGRLRSAGQAICGVDIAVVDGEDHELPKGQIGEIVVRGPGVMLGYWNKPEETAEALRGGWMHTGDAGYMDEDGFLFVVDRIKDMIVTGAENVYSAEVENALSRHAAVATCAVVGVPSEKWGESVHAVIVLRPDATVTEEELRAHCRTLIAGYKCPRTIEFRAALPISGAGKLLKFKLREEFWQGRERQVG